ncbi:1-acyl-sn-glycerol-3-phosphate acyltransferase alpha [Lucilia cuprina]|uniref:1-acyl-sn-glycerol-3-phosphate acyltransferase alpha n=1 Tax=Lucilia cuprina TaxID=7375 RepID=UPI001F06A68A|nr:1-acyl-sn-glycerol-3-phosphate acyltransferase alpha [Lucilia cuprina]XP_046802191.1 1-acyl-sn-glycerol-3-phosphate acyltransferase alpha [Lucilia cuprina]XP_046802192.1 1-acyl-sn-glycerol-3-phosphate acyltransferase alpha [Lucilia cuprina]XP_046802193.1 1-acyl-sn-glycerol-3-phosphate acyltransferase alpha [Lucilia cuprina]XP_046802194.1 1-acyl-sn-glycerol-3-phosphate acyltransferase alpha [Lucilia cuprina]XP_046802195.1 1-acyl-sn-glycerol-3-phosphate acyltransferase alpha [Lucilia cuprina]
MTTYIELFGLMVLLMLPFLYETSHIFRYYFKFLIYYGLVSFNSIVLIPAFMCRPCDVRNLLWASTFCHRITTLIGLRWELRGKEHLEKDRACIIVANHQSSLDVLGMFNIWHIMDKCTVVAKRELFYAWPFGLAAWLAGLIFIDRVRGEKARDTLNQVNSKIKKQKIKLWVFPEGTRRNTGDIHPFKKGAFHMAIDEQIPIMPVVFSSYCSFLNDKKKILNAGNIILTTLPPISTEGLTKDDLPELMEKVHKIMQETFKQTSNEVLQRYAANAIIKPKNSDIETTPVKQTIANTPTTLLTGSADVLSNSATKATNSLSCDLNSLKTSCSDTSQAEDIVNNTQTNATTSTAAEGEEEQAVTDFKDPVITKTQALVH